MCCRCRSATHLPPVSVPIFSCNSIDCFGFVAGNRSKIIKSWKVLKLYSCEQRDGSSKEHSLNGQWQEA